jgi:hypothetical protein
MDVVRNSVVPNEAFCDSRIEGGEAVVPSEATCDSRMEMV